MELFNLDELVTASRHVQLFGNRYAISDRTVGQMISALKIAESAETASPEYVLEQMIETAHQIIPDCPMDYIQRLNLNQLQALIKFASESDEDTENAAENPEGK